MMTDLSLRNLITIAFKNVGWIVLIVGGALAAAIIYFFVATNIYQSRATLVVRFGSDIRPELQLNERQLELPSSRDERRELIESYLRILQSRDYSGRLIREFGVAKLYPDLLEEKGSGMARLEDAAIARLRDSIVVKSGTQTNVLELTVFHPDRALALALLTRLIDMVIATQADLYENPQLAFTRTQMEDALRSLESAQDRLNARRQGTGIFAYEQQFQLLLSQQNMVADNIFNLQARIAEAQGRQQRLEAILGTVPQNVTGVADAGRYKELQDLGNELARLRAEAGDADDRQAIAAKERLYQNRLRDIQSLNRGGSSELHQAMLTDYLRSSADAQAARMASDYWGGEQLEIAARVERMQRDNQSVVDLTREVDLDEATYRALKRQSDDAAVSQKLNDERITRVTVIDEPYVDPRPARPRKFLILVGALVGSILSSAALVIVKEAMSDRIVLPSQIEAGLRLKVIASFRRFDRRAMAS